MSEVLLQNRKRKSQNSMNRKYFGSDPSSSEKVKHFIEKLNFQVKAQKTVFSQYTLNLKCMEA